MEIMYLWLNKYRNFVQQGFNFSPEFFFDIRPEGSSSTHFSLTITKNPRSIPGFFDLDNILNVTAIVGQNGTGKSNLLDFIKDNFHSNNFEIDVPCVLAYRDSEGSHIIYPAEMQLDHNGELHSFQPRNYPVTHMTAIDETTPLFKKTHLIYYSNIVDLRTEQNYKTGFSNLSTIALMRSDAESKRKETGEEWIDAFQAYREAEIARNVQFILSEHLPMLDFPLPGSLYLQVLTRDLNLLAPVDSAGQPTLATTPWGKVLLIMDEKIKLQLMSEDMENGAFNQILFALFVSFIAAYNPDSPLVRMDLPPFLDNGQIEEYIRGFFTNLSSNASLHTDDGKPMEHSNFNELAKNVPDLINLLHKLINEGVLVRSKAEPKVTVYWDFKITSDTEHQLKQLLDLYRRSRVLSDFLSFNWASLSSGQQSFFSMVSRFYSLELNRELNGSSAIILIDEGDICFHPEWQKSYFDKTINFISKLFKRDIQVIFTSNTPFITSDLPKDNIIFIEKEENANAASSIKVKAPDTMKDTFAGNIHTLYSDTFFMKGVLMGDFAKKKIDKIIAFITDDKSKVPMEKFRKTIELIGEDVLKWKLREMWIAKFGREEEIRILRTRLNDLENNQS